MGISLTSTFRLTGNTDLASCSIEISFYDSDERGAGSRNQCKHDKIKKETVDELSKYRIWWGSYFSQITEDK